MFKINGNEIQLKDACVFLGNCSNNGEIGYTIGIDIKFNINDKEGFLYVDSAYQKEKDINSFINRTYEGEFMDESGSIDLIEFFDGINHYDSELLEPARITYGSLEDGKIKTNLYVNYINHKIELDDNLDFIDKTREI